MSEKRFTNYLPQVDFVALGRYFVGAQESLPLIASSNELMQPKNELVHEERTPPTVYVIDEPTKHSAEQIQGTADLYARRQQRFTEEIQFDPLLEQDDALGAALTVFIAPLINDDGKVSIPDSQKESPHP